MNKGLPAILPAIFVVTLAALEVVAQAEPKPDINSDTSKDDILILVNVTARELKFDVVPKTSVEFPGTHRRTTMWVTQRQNLPDKVEPGVTYRNIGIQLRISSRFQDIEQIVREALGEVPVSDNPLPGPPVNQPPAANPQAKPAAPPPRSNRRRQRK